MDFSIFAKIFLHRAHGATHQPVETPATVAIQSFMKSGKGYKSVEFTQQVRLLDNSD